MDFDTFMILAICFGIFFSITSFRAYRRTGLRCHLFWSLGPAVGSICLIGMGYLGFTYKNDFLFELFFLFFGIPGLILCVIGSTLFYTVESGAVQESYKGRSILDRMLGNVSPIEKEKEYKAAVSPKLGMMMGLLIFFGGIAQCMDDKSARSFSDGSSGDYYLFLLGVAVFIVSLFALYGEKLEKEEKETTAISEEQKAAAMLEFYSDFEKQKKAAMHEFYYDIVCGIISTIIGVYKCYNAYPAISYLGIYLALSGFILFARAFYLYGNWGGS